MSAWHDLVTASLIGTERTMVPLVGIPGLPPVVDDTGDSAAVLLDRAALLTAARRAGRRADRAEPLPVCEPDTRPTVSPAAGRRLARLLSGEHPELLTEWLTAAAARGLRPPPQFLPDLLDRARRAGSADPSLPRLIADAGGPRARWLASLNPDWESVLVETGDTAWRLGRTGQRRAYLAALRARDPGAARELIADSWAAAGPDERVMFAGVLADGLSPADEPLLEAALHDGTTGVRKTAADVLAALPGSAFSRRMAEHAVRWLRMAHGEHGPRLVIVPQPGAEAAMRRYGIMSDPGAAAPQAERARLIGEIVARTPLQAWPQEFGLTAAQIVAMSAGDWAPLLFIGWSRAALSQGDREWITVLISQALSARPPVTATEIAALSRLMLRADPRLGAPDVLPGPGPEAPPALWPAIRTLQFRYQMLKELDHDHGDG